MAESAIASARDAEANLLQQNYKEAAELYSKLLEDEEDSSRFMYYNNRSLCYFEVGRYAESSLDCQAALDLLVKGGGSLPVTPRGGPVTPRGGAVTPRGGTTPRGSAPVQKAGGGGKAKRKRKAKKGGKGKGATAVDREVVEPKPKIVSLTTRGNLLLRLIRSQYLQRDFVSALNTLEVCSQTEKGVLHSNTYLLKLLQDCKLGIPAADASRVAAAAFPYRRSTVVENQGEGGALVHTGDAISFLSSCPAVSLDTFTGEASRSAHVREENFRDRNHTPVVVTDGPRRIELSSTRAEESGGISLLVDGIASGYNILTTLVDVAHQLEPLGAQTRDEVKENLRLQVDVCDSDPTSCAKLVLYLTLLGRSQILGDNSPESETVLSLLYYLFLSPFLLSKLYPIFEDVVSKLSSLSVNDIKKNDGYITLKGYVEGRWCRIANVEHTWGKMQVVWAEWLTPRYSVEHVYNNYAPKVCSSSHYSRILKFSIII